jgi:acyl-CoA thioester hydrolase
MTSDDEFRFSHRLRVRWAEVDPQGIVFNGHYLTYFDVGMTEYLRALGLPYPDGFLAYGGDLFLVKATVEFKSPARYDDEIDCHVRIGRVGSSSVQFCFELRRGDELLASGENVYVNADAETRRPVPVAQAVRDIVDAYERGASSGQIDSAVPPK